MFLSIIPANTFDPLQNFGLHSRQLLCDAVIDANQFSLEYSQSYYEKAPRQRKKVQLEDQNPFDGIINGSLNYQRSTPSQEQVQDPPYFDYKIRIFGTYHRIGAIQCVDKIVRWYVTFGFVEKFMYLLKYHQIGRKKIRSFLRIIGMLEPSAVVNNQPVEYFYSQFRSSRGKQ